MYKGHRIDHSGSLFVVDVRDVWQDDEGAARNIVAVLEQTPEHFHSCLALAAM